MDAELRQVLTVLITVAGTSASTLLGLVLANRLAATRARLEIEERERQRRDETAEQRRQWLRDMLLAPLEEERRKAHAELCSILWIQRRAEMEESPSDPRTPCDFPIRPTADEVRRAAQCLAYVNRGLAQRVWGWAEKTHWGMYESKEDTTERLQLIGLLSDSLDPRRLTGDDPVVRAVLGEEAD